jgi:dolichol-phosphate mannosyltransferase
VSVITPTYNERENIEPLFDGLRAALEGYWDFELIVVDDNSPDGTSETLRRQQERDPRISLIRRPYKQGLGSALVEGFAQATGDC